MFSFFKDMTNYEQRKVARNDYPWGMIDTARVSDGRKPYETAVEHKKYGDGSMVIVECYDTKKHALEGHARWVKTMTAKRLPKILTDCSNSEIQQALTAIDPEATVKARVTTPAS